MWSLNVFYFPTTHLLTFQVHNIGSYKKKSHFSMQKSYKTSYIFFFAKFPSEQTFHSEIYSVQIIRKNTNKMYSKPCPVF